jgi:hypothetical protein
MPLDDHCTRGQPRRARAPIGDMPAPAEFGYVPRDAAIRDRPDRGAMRQMFASPRSAPLTTILSDDDPVRGTMAVRRVGS